MLDSRDLRFFVTIANQPSLAAAARVLNVTPPTVTQRLQLIESRLQLKLLERTSGKMRLTEEGEVLIQRANSILAELDDLETALYNNREQVRGRLRVLAPLGFGNEYIAPLLAEFRQLHPNLEIELRLSDQPRWLEGDSWDLMIYIGELRDSTLILHKLAPNRRIACASPDYLKKAGTPRQPDELKDHHCIALRENEEDVTLWRFQHRREKQQQAIRISPQLACNEGSVVKQWAKQGLGIIVRSEWDIAPQLESGELVSILEDYQLPDADIVALTSSDNRSQAARTQEFLRYLKEQLSVQPWYSHTESDDIPT